MNTARFYGYFRYLFLLVVMFLFTTEIPIISILTSRRLAIVIALLRLASKQSQIKSISRLLDVRKVRSFIALLSFACLISIIHVSFRDSGYSNASYFEPWYFLYLFLYVYVFSLFCAVEFRTLKEFVFVICGVYIIQSGIVLGGVLNTGFRMYIYENFYFGDDRFDKTVTEGLRFIGINLAGADGSVKMSTAILFLVALKLSNNVKSFIFWTVYLFIFVGTIFIGRTGTIVEIALILPIVATGSHKIGKVFQITIISILAVSAVSYLLSLIDPVLSDYLLNWITAIFDEERRAGVSSGVIKQGIPPFSINFIFGTGMDVGYSTGGVTYDSDSGLIRTYMAIGVVGFILYYLSMFKLLTSVYIERREMRLFFGLCVLLAFAIEYKEPFMLKYMFPQAILTCRLLYVKERTAQQ